MSKWRVRRSCVHPSERPPEFVGTPDLVEDAMQELATKSGHGELFFKYFRKHGCWEIHSFFVKRNRTTGVYMKLQEILDAASAPSHNG
jgi:hypothetical protein